VYRVSQGQAHRCSNRFQQAINVGEQINVSTVVLFELWYGVEKSEQKEANTNRLETFLAGPRFTRRIVGFGFIAALWMDSHCTGCSIEPFTHRHCRNISVLTMIRCIGSISGRPILRVLDVKEIKTVPSFRYRIPSGSD
jgi:hypothetical protein